MSDPRALIIEDDPNIAAGVQMRLRHAGFQTRIACDGVEGLDEIQQWSPEVVLLDVQMPRLDGIEMLGQLKQILPDHPPVIMLSASLRDRQVSLEAGAQYFLKKPYRSEDLLHAVSNVISPPQQ